MFVVLDKFAKNRVAVLDTSDNVIELIVPEELKIVELKGHKVVFSEYRNFLDDLVKFCSTNLNNGVLSQKDVEELIRIQNAVNIDSVRLICDDCMKCFIEVHMLGIGGLAVAVVSYSKNIDNCLVAELVFNNNITFVKHTVLVKDNVAKSSFIVDDQFPIKVECDIIENRVGIVIRIYNNISSNKFNYVFMKKSGNFVIKGE